MRGVVRDGVTGTSSDLCGSDKDRVLETYTSRKIDPTAEGSTNVSREEGKEVQKLVWS